MGEKRASHIVHVSTKNATHADIFMFKQETGEWNYHLRLCAVWDWRSICSEKVTVSYCPLHADDLCRTAISFDVSRNILQNSNVNVFLIRPATPQSVQIEDKKYVTLLNFLYPIHEERKYFAQLQGSIGNLVLFAKGLLFDGVQHDKIILRISGDNRGTIEWGSFKSGVGTFEIEYAQSSSMRTKYVFMFKNIQGAVPREICEFVSAIENTYDRIVYYSGILSSAFDIEVYTLEGVRIQKCFCV